MRPCTDRGLIGSGSLTQCRHGNPREGSKNSPHGSLGLAGMVGMSVNVHITTIR